MKIRQLIILMITVTVLASLTAACSPANEPAANLTDVPLQDDPAAPAPTPTTVPTSLVVCLGEAPNTLYPYGSPNSAAQLILQAVYDQPVEQRGYAFQPVILDGLPDIAAGTAGLQTVSMQSGDKVLDSQGNVVDLDLGVFIRPAGCASGDCALAFDGQPVEMDQMTAIFSLRPGIAWSDGAPLTVADSIFGFSLNADPATPASRYKLDRTLSYEAVDESTIQWTGIPGFIDPDYQENFWLPAPQHLWGEIPATELVTSELAALMPVGYGPFVLADAQPDTYTLMRNPNYFRAAEGLPRVDRLVFRVVGQDPETNLDMLRTAECDVLEPGAAAGIPAEEVVSLAESGGLIASWANHNGWTLLNFGVVPQSYDDDYSMWGRRPPGFLWRPARPSGDCLLPGP